MWPGSGSSSIGVFCAVSAACSWPSHRSEGDEPPGHDVLFNLARETDKKLGELAERQQAGDILNDLGIASLQGEAPQDLAARALDLVRRTGDLDRCFIVDTSGTEIAL